MCVVRVSGGDTGCVQWPLRVLLGSLHCLCREWSPPPPSSVFLYVFLFVRCAGVCVGAWFVWFVCVFVEVCVFSYGRLCWVVWVPLVWRFMVYSCVFAGLFAGLFAGVCFLACLGVWQSMFALRVSGLASGRPKPGYTISPSNLPINSDRPKPADWILPVKTCR